MVKRKISKDLVFPENEQWNLSNLDRKLQNSIATKALEMQKMVREAEYFKTITHDEIDKKMRFMERVVRGIRSIEERSQDSEDQGSHSE